MFDCRPLRFHVTILDTLFKQAHMLLSPKAVEFETDRRAVISCDWNRPGRKRESGKGGTVKNARLEKARLENAAPNCRGRKLGKRRIWTAKCHFIRCCSTTAYLTRVVYKWFNVRVLRKVHDIGSSLGATGKSCNVCLTILCVVLCRCSRKANIFG